MSRFICLLILVGTLWFCGCAAALGGAGLGLPGSGAVAPIVCAAPADAPSVDGQSIFAAAPTTEPATTQPSGMAQGDAVLVPDAPPTLAEASRTFKETKPLRLVLVDGQLVLEGVEDFARRHESFTRLMEAYFLTADRITGMDKEQVDQVFGQGTPAPAPSTGAERYIWDAGRDMMVLEYRDGRVAYAAYVLGD